MTFGGLLIIKVIKLKIKYDRNRVMRTIEPHLLFLVVTGYVYGLGIKVKMSQMFQNFVFSV